MTGNDLFNDFMDGLVKFEFDFQLNLSSAHAKVLIPSILLTNAFLA